MTFRPHPQGEKRRRSATAAIKLVLKFDRTEVLPIHIRNLINTMLWKITEADGKHQTRYQSADALECSGKPIHEHVYPWAQMIDKLLTAKSEQEIDQLLAQAEGCLVTPDEHVRLSHSGDMVGWDRYRKAGIVAINNETGKKVTERPLGLFPHPHYDVPADSDQLPQTSCKHGQISGRRTE
jgi:hypothetical protein